MSLSAHDRATLLSIARSTLQAAACGRALPEFDIRSESLLASRPAFVTLRVGEHLRGCIGLIEPSGPLWKAVRDMTVQSATADPRFEPIRADEMLTIEISILSPLQRVQGPSQIIRGRHGLYIRLGGKLGLLLPQVWSELGCTAEEFARHTCVKAGLPPDAWKLPPTELFAFEAEIISN